MKQRALYVRYRDGSRWFVGFVGEDFDLAAWWEERKEAMEAVDIISAEIDEESEEDI